jgi:ADP-ribosylglycohydrolase
VRSARTTWARLFAVAYDADPYRNFVDAVAPDSEVTTRLRLVAARPFTTEPQWVAAEVGSGALISAPDTVAYAVWWAARHLDDLVEALWATASAGGDIDTACAMVGGRWRRAPAFTVYPRIGGR